MPNEDAPDQDQPADSMRLGEPAPSMAVPDQVAVTLPPPADLGQRLLARVIDTGLVFVAAVLVYQLRFGGDDITITDDGAILTQGPGTVESFFWATGLTILISALYEIGMTAYRGGTIGKDIARARVVMANTGEQASLGASAVRWLVPFFSFFLCGVGQVLVYASPLLDTTKTNQGWHDRAAGTAVVRK